MNIETFRTYCLSKKGVTEEFPFNETTLVFKVMGKMFALTGLDNIPFSVNLKCDPDRSLELREYHPEIQPGYHMSKKHWNTVNFSGSLTTNMLCELTDHSYKLVVSGLTKKAKQELENINS